MGNLGIKAQGCQEVEISKRLAKKRQKQWEHLIQTTENTFSEVDPSNLGSIQEGS